MTMNILGLDPGNKKTGWCVYDAEKKAIVDKGINANEDLIWMYSPTNPYRRVDCCVIEMIGHYGTGMPAGKTVFETCIWIGRFYQRMGTEFPIRFILRPTIKTKICGSPKAKDGNVRQALIDRFEPLGGGKVPQIGTKALPGPLYGFKSHIWSALAVCIAGAELWDSLKRFPE